MNIINTIKRFITKHYAPYTVMYVDPYWDTVEEVHYSWTFKDAVEWAACSLREEGVVIYKHHNLVAWRSEQY